MGLGNVFDLIQQAFGGVLSFGDIIKQFLLSVVCIIPVELVPVITTLVAVVLVIVVLKFVNLVIPFM